jgi:hypothetical protein
MPEELTPIEKEVYELIQKSGELLTTDVPANLRGAVPHLINKGLIEAYKRQTLPWTSKKRKFLRIKDAWACYFYNRSTV